MGEPLVLSVRRVVEKCQERPAARVLLVDGDNSLVADTCALVFCSYAPPNAAALESLGRSAERFLHLSIVRAANLVVGAADANLTFALCSLAERLPSARIDVVSLDRFVVEAASTASAWRRQWASAGPVGRIEAKEPSQVAREVAPGSPELAEECEREREESQRAPALSRAERSAEGREERLRELYDQRWAGTHAEFCREYQIDQANFSKWRRGIKRSPASARAVSQWAQSIGAACTEGTAVDETEASCGAGEATATPMRAPSVSRVCAASPVAVTHLGTAAASPDPDVLSYVAASSTVSAKCSAAPGRDEQSPSKCEVAESRGQKGQGFGCGLCSPIRTGQTAESSTGHKAVGGGFGFGFGWSCKTDEASQSPSWRHYKTQCLGSNCTPEKQAVSHEAQDVSSNADHVCRQNVAQSSPSPRQSSCSADRNPAELREWYAQNWKGTQSAFCKQHGIDQANFSKWLRGLKSSPASERAVSAWMSTSAVLESWADGK
eukprot:m51a1_g2968 hypothetical protein (495) ;mRNA; r:696914-698483